MKAKIDYVKLLLVVLVSGMSMPVSGEPLPSESLDVRTVIEIGIDLGYDNYLYNPRSFNGKNYIAQINSGTKGLGCYPVDSSVYEALARIVNDPGTRMAGPFPTADYILAAGDYGNDLFSRFDPDLSLSSRVFATNVNVRPSSYDWVDENTIIHNSYLSGLRQNLYLTDVNAEPFQVTANTTWNANGYVTTPATVRIRNVRVGDVYSGYAYYGDAAVNTAGFWAINLATGVSTRLGTVEITGSGSWGLWTVKELDGYLYVHTTDNGIYIYNMIDATTLGTLHTRYTKDVLDALTESTDQNNGFDVAADGRRMLITAGRGRAVEFGLPRMDPVNGAVNVLVDTNLSWQPPPAFTPEKYDLRYKAGDPNFATGTVTEVFDIARTDPCNVYDPLADFANGKTVYWRVDSYWPGASDPCIGDVWSFTTVPAEPVVTKDPVSLTVAAGGTAVFNVEDIGGETYVWKRQRDNETVGGNSSVLTLTDVQVDPCEDSYYCIVSNTYGSALPSAAATLWTKRLIARWEFEDDLLDAEADNWDGVYTDPNSANEPPTPVFVLDPCSIDGGKALQLTADELHVRITDSEDFFNFYPLGYTVNVWVKTEQDADYGCMASKQDRNDYPDIEGWVLNCTNTGVAAHGLRQVFGGDAGVSVVGTSNIADNQWRMVTATYDAETGTGSVYVDGELENQLVDTARKAPLNYYPVVLGAETVSAEVAGYEGLLDKVSIYSYALSTIDVAVLYTDVMTDKTICVEQPEHDFNDDCRVDMLDFAMFSTGWLECNLVPECMP
ncbi:MAG: hypothetical protein KAJ52_08575 [Sedimentisphaerales bacterium]|nr:hypothetical protein [Sedimentisphaerales bacterium]